VWADERAVQAIEKLARKITRDKTNNQVVAMDLGNSKVTDADLKELNGLKSLQELDLRDTQITTPG
jgi:hypothetical protein